VNLRGCLACDACCSRGCVGDSDIRCKRLAVENVFSVAVQGFSISTTVVSMDSPRVCANPLILW
jgi:hypothetical protein